MLTEIAVIEGYHRKFGKDISEGDLTAFMRLATGFDVMHYETYEEAHDALQASIQLMNDECDHAETEEEHAAIVMDRLGFLHRTQGPQ
jgi:hypothetical protein